jgi:hypothetical protein
MDVQQEYFKRHGFDLKPVCYPHDDAAHNIILFNKCADNQTQPPFVIASFQLHKQENHPSYYKVLQYISSYDTGSQGGSALKTVWDKKVYYDEWDDFIRVWSESNKGELVPVSFEKLLLASIELFIYSHDSWLASNLHDRHKDMLVDILDDTIAFENRLLALKEIEEAIRVKSKNVYATLSSLRGYADRPEHADWIEKLLL